ncbi:MAG: hypothetical protein ABI203_01895 [Mucilaginibacter sp.]
MMLKYGNDDHATGVVAYYTASDSIIVKFREKGYYKYTTKSAGTTAIRKMKALAKQGRGLSTYISQHIHDKYESKWE